MYKNIEAQIWSENFPKTMKNLKYEYGNLPNESLGQEKHFKHVFGVGVGWEFEKMWIKIKNIRASADISWLLWKKSVIHSFFYKNQ